MLNIPQVIKDRFKTDSVLKNVRITFPNGERDDISNDRLIKESLKFDESVSSREEIEFGLCESSRLSFECVDVGNIREMTIDASIEVDATGIDKQVCPITRLNPIIILATPDGETEEKIFVVCDFPEINAGEVYISDDGTGLYWTADDNEGTSPVWMQTIYVGGMTSLNYYRNVTGVDPRGTYEDMYDGYHGGGYARTYLFSTRTRNFYPVWVDGYVYDYYDGLPFYITLQDSFRSNAFLKAIHNMQYDTDEHIFYYNVEIETSSDVPFPFYRVPLGRFVVDECKRDTKMKLRKVTAYSKISSLAEYDWWTEVDWDLPSLLSSAPFVNLDIINFIAATNKGMFKMSGNTTLGPWVADSSGNQFSFFFISSTNNKYFFTVTPAEFYIKLYDLNVNAPWPSTQRIAYLDSIVYEPTYDDTLEGVLSAMRNDDFEEEAVIYIKNFIEKLRPFNPVTSYKNSSIYSHHASNHIEEWKGKHLEVGEPFLLPPYISVYSYIDINAHKESETDTYYGTVEYLDQTVSQLGADGVVIKEIELFSGHRDTLKVYADKSSEWYDFNWTFKKSILFTDKRKLLEANTELQGMFGRINRYGYFDMLSLSSINVNGLFPDSNLFPQDILYPADFDDNFVENSKLAILTENEMISMWYEEYFIAYGSLTCEYMSSEVLDENDEPTSVVYQSVWNSDSKFLTYKLDNEIIKNGVYTQAEIEALLDPLINALKELKFYPSNLSCIGLPYIEAGDWVIASMYGNKVLNLCLSRTLNGIQALTDKMKSD